MTAIGPTEDSGTFRVLTAVIAVYHLAVVSQLPTWFGVFLPNQVHQAVSLCAALLLLYAFPGVRGAPARRAARIKSPACRRIVDRTLLAFGLFGGGFVVVFHSRILEYSLYGFLDATGILLSILLVVSIFEAVRRVAGLAIPTIVAVIVLLTMFQQWLPGALSGTSFPIERIMFSVYVGDAGIFGLPLNVAANIVIVYMVFGALMERAGAGKWFIDIALSLAGSARGGPAKAAVLASAIFGSISGSPSGNAATTGVFTIPMMRSVGYSPQFAAATEAVASTGGMILPPVMGAIAFLMAEWIGMPYVDIALAAAVPAFLYILIVFVSVDLQARKENLGRADPQRLPGVRTILRRGWHHLLPVIALLYLLVIAALSPGIAGAYACIAVVASSYLGKDRRHWLTPSNIAAALQAGVSRWVVVALITAAVGVMIGSLELSGLGIKLSRFIVELAGGDLLMTLILVGVASLVIGMGLDATPAYVTLATLMAPALIRLDVPDIAAHLFVVYWGLASFYTPPTCIALFVTCGIAGSNIWESGWEAIRLGIAAFVVPFAFVLNPGLLLIGKGPDILRGVTAAVIAALFLACAVRGFALHALGGAQRLLLLIAAAMLIAPAVEWNILGALGGAAMLAATAIAARNTR